METKLIEIRDRATFIPALAIRLESRTEAERYLLARAGYGRNHEDHLRYVLLWRVAGDQHEATCDPYTWRSSTMQVAHDYLERAWDTVASGTVVDAEYLRGESAAPKRSERTC